MRFTLNQRHEEVKLEGMRFACKHCGDFLDSSRKVESYCAAPRVTGVELSLEELHAIAVEPEIVGFIRKAYDETGRDHNWTIEHGRLVPEYPQYAWKRPISRRRHNVAGG